MAGKNQILPDKLIEHRAVQRCAPGLRPVAFKIVWSRGAQIPIKPKPFQHPENIFHIFPTFPVGISIVYPK